MAETQNVKMSTALKKDQDKNIIKNGSESIDDSGIEIIEEKEKAETNVALNCPWILGQLAWARGSSYPFWPCVVTLDPKTMQYHKLQNKGRSQALMVHVQYFGDGGRHNWVLSHYMMPFSGLDDFHNRAKTVNQETKKKDPKYAAAFCPKLGVKKQWGIGVTEASGLMHLSNEERASIFEPVIPPPEQIQPSNNKLKRKLSARGSKISTDTPTSGPKKFKKIEHEDQSGKLVPIPEPASIVDSKLEAESLSSESTSALEKKFSQDAAIVSRRISTRNQNKNIKENADVPKRQYVRKKAPKLSEEERNRRDEIDFDDYYNLNKDFWKADHPDATDEEIRKLLREMWNDMDAEEKRNNLNRNFDEYRYNSATGQSNVKRLKQTTLQQEKENLKNTENALQESNKSIAKFNGKKDEGSEKSNSENDKGTEVPKTTDNPQKEKNSPVFGTKDNSENESFDESSKTEVVSQNGISKDFEEKTRNSQEDAQNENLKQNTPKVAEAEKIYKSNLDAEKAVPEMNKNTTEMEVKTVEKGERNIERKMEVDKEEISDEKKLLCTNCQKPKA